MSEKLDAVLKLLKNTESDLQGTLKTLIRTAWPI